VGCASGGTCSYSPSVALSTGTAEWRVLAWNPTGYSSWSSTLLFTVLPDTTAPSVSITIPLSGAAVSGTVVIEATASDDVGVAGVQFKVDGIPLGAEHVSIPYSQSWDTASSTNGNHVLTATARDAAGNVGTSSSVLVTVDNWPVRISSRGKYLEDQSGRPFLVVGDAAWDLPLNLSEADAIAYLDDRQRKGFTAIEIAAITRWGPFNAPNNYYDEPPFVNGPSDWSVRGEAYWTRLDRLLLAMKHRGMLVILFPAFLGYGCSGLGGWCDDMVAQSDAAMFEYGQWIGNRYKDYGNILWMTGGDTVATGAALSRNNAVVSGIRSVDSDAIFSLEPIRDSVGGIDSYVNVVDINAVYSGDDPQTLVHRAYNHNRPFMLQEARYENQYGYGLFEVESQALITYLGGGLVGHIFGSCPLYGFGSTDITASCYIQTPPFDNWQNNLNSPGSLALGSIGKLMASRKWWTMVPDYANAVVLSPKGTAFHYVATAREASGETVMVWAPNSNQITVDMTKIGGSQANAWWYNPDNNSSTFVGVYATTGTRQFSPPNVRRVLVLDNVDSSLAAPGTTAYVPGPTPPP
jgi:hypothetical protein